MAARVLMLGLTAVMAGSAQSQDRPAAPEITADPGGALVLSAPDVITFNYGSRVRPEMIAPA